jgi:DNA modification methylase
MPKCSLPPTFKRAAHKFGDALDRANISRPLPKRERRAPPRLEHMNPELLRPDPANARIHSPQQVRALARNIQRYGFTSPILVSSDDQVIAGHGRLEASKLIGLESVPIIRLNLSQAQSKAFNIWDNRSSDLSHFDDKLLGLALQQVIELKIDIEDTGFSVAEADRVIEFASGVEANTADDEVPSPANFSVTEPGDVWDLGVHRVFCGDAQSASSYRLLLQGKLAQAVFTDVPYNLAGRTISGKGKIRHASFKMAAGEMSAERYFSFLRACLTQAADHSANGSLHFHCIDWRHLRDLQAAADGVYSELLNLCVWVKNNGGMGSLYRSRHELILVYKSGRGRHRNNVKLGRYGRNRTNVWEYSGGNSFGGRTTEEGNLLQLHPTVKPVQMVADALLDCTARGDVVLDPFLGSGSTLIASERTGRICYGMDLDPLYVDVAIRRWQRHTGNHAIEVASGRRFDDVAAGGEETHEGR